MEQKHSDELTIERGKSRLAIDCGHVINFIDKRKQGSKKHLIKNCIISEECILSIKKLVTLFGKRNTFILSKKYNDGMCCAVATMLKRNNFYNKTGFEEGNVYFCRLREGGLLLPKEELEFRTLKGKDFSIKIAV